MNLLDHVSIAVSDMEKARVFYDAVMASLDVAKVHDGAERLGYGTRCSPGDDEHSYLSILLDTEHKASRRLHWCFKAATREEVDAFYRAGIRAGGVCDGEPGIRAHYHSAYYAAFLLDPSGNRVEAVCHRG